MVGIMVATIIPAAPAAVWDELAALERHAEWMAEAERIEFTGEQRSGVGTGMEVVTRVGPLRTVDRMVVDRWEEGRVIGVIHRGLVAGEGLFTLEAVAAGCRLTWQEHLRFPWFLGGRLGAWLAKPVLRRIWAANLDRLAQRLT